MAYSKTLCVCVWEYSCILGMWLKIQMNHHLGEAMKVLKLGLQPLSKPELEAWNLYSWAHRE